MVVLSAAVCTKTGRVLVSRQFVEMSRVRIEGLLAAFPKLMGTEKQHNFIETDSVRYLYHPLENLYMLVVTTKSSNILEDLETLHILAKLVPEYCRSLEEEEVLNNLFELIFAFDEVVALGYKEAVTIQQIRTFTEMDSHEEKVFEMMEKNKLREAKEEAIRKQRQIEKEKAEQMKALGGGHGKFTGIAGGIGSNTGGHGIHSGMGGGMGGMGSSSSSSSSTEVYVVKSAPVPENRQTNTVTKKGMSLSKGNSKTNDILKQLEAAGELETPVSSGPASASAPAAGAKKESIHISVEEKIVASVEHDGGVDNFEIKGDLNLTVTDPSSAIFKIKLNNDLNKNFQFKTHPNIDRNGFVQNNLIGLKDASRPFPAGGVPLGVLKWRWQSKDEGSIPLSVSCWPSRASESSTVVNMEYELLDTSLQLADVSITIPIPGSYTPVVNSADGHYKAEPKKQLLIWSLPLIDADSSTGSMEFTLPWVGDNSSFFPINVSFSTTKSFSKLQIDTVLGPGGPLPFSKETSVTTELYEIH